MLNLLEECVVGLTTPDVIFLLIGGALGVFYGFDGWRGSTENIPLKNSPRVKNFLWAIGGAFFIVIADLKSVIPQLNKQRALLAYLLAFAALSVLTILAWGIGIFLKFTWIRFFDRDRLPAPPFTPFADYLRYGYEFHNTQYREALKRKEIREDQFLRAFLPSYIRQLSYAITAVYSYRKSPDINKKREVETSILRSLCAVVAEYYGKQANLEVNANYMVAFHKSLIDRAILDRLRFAFGDMGRYEFFLALSEYAEDRGRENFILPVENRNSPKAQRLSLPGAPLAFVRNNTEIVDDVGKIRYGKDIPSEVIGEMSEYFTNKNFRSFGSINIAGGGKQLGVVNVESNFTHVFGKTQAQKKEIVALLHPFCSLLAFVITPNEIER